ncbi:helix-turn-helix transcriptional regulator [Sinomonas sp. ASV486]|uniref:helix-turn-helix transcriptional regulator n=1 Tax=Sinomonas sp. ASV486 TaxID=3051170 RepID=UPI0027DBDE72|nr:helix-turn-helix transcriptional regulator [Sinomonas sp. ASV486]MDQ4490337.1 helix-turn-helix transcriptional regulator [Sinomonas sp. ASV486]
MGIRLGLSGDSQIIHDAQARLSDRLAWARVVRAKEIATAEQALADPSTYGVVVTGDASFGKSAVASVLLNDLEAVAYTVRLRSTIMGTETPYGALNVLLARLPEDAQDDPGTIMRGILQLLASDARGREAVMSLETSHNLDELSTATLVNVMVTGTAKLVIVADRASELPTDFHWMLSEERLREVPLAALDPEDTLTGVRELLGALVPQTVALQLHGLSRGNPQVLLLTVSELLQRGALTVADGVWTLPPDTDTSGIRQLDDLVRARFQRHPAQIQEIIEALACARRIPLVRLASTFRGEDLAQMERDGLLAIDEGGRQSVSLADALMGDVVRGWLSVPRRRELRALLMADGEPPLDTITNLELLGLAAWARECHALLPTGHAIAAAAESLRLYDAKFALECLDGVERDPSTWPTVQRLRARAFLVLQLPRQSLACLDQVSAAELDAEGPVEMATFVAIRAEALRWVPEGARATRDLLADVRGELLIRAGTGASSDAENARAAALLDLAEFEYWAFLGEFGRIVGRLEATVADPNPVDEETRLMAASILMEARTVLGREQEGLALLHELTAQINLGSGPLRMRRAFATRAFDVLLLNGHWRQALALLKAAPQWSPHYLSTSGASVELAVGLAYVYAGRGHEAIGSLLSATALFERTPASRWLGLACAATAFAYAQQGDTPSARKWLSRLEDCEPAAGYRTASYIDFCSAMARRWIGEPHAAAMLVESAREDIAHGRWNPAGIKLVGATVEGSEDDLRLLEDVCAHRQGPLAEIGERLARGTRTGSLDDLAAAADLAASLELDALESRCAAVALDVAHEINEVVVARFMQARLDTLAGRVVILPVVPSRAPRVLTQREREVAALAAMGESNRRIAEDLGLSVRTVEGHLYQVFSKLAVSTRTELAEFL